MDIAIALVVLVAVVLAVSGASKRFDLSTPLVLIAFGAAVSYLPFVPEVRLSAEIVLVGLLPPLLYATALKSSLVDFNANRRAILMLSIGLVAFTTVGVGFVVHALIPGLAWPAAFAVGAVVAPPDAVAATAIGRRIGLPRRVVTVLEGESLLNDATALVALRTAVAAAAVGSFSVLSTSLDFLVAAGVGVLVGLVMFAVIGWVRKHLTDPAFDTSVSFVTPFAAYVAAEELHGSGILAVVIAGLLLGHNAPVLQTASSRIAERLNWRTVSFLLENVVFLLIGLQARWILDDVANSPLSSGRIAGVCAAALATTILLRFVWVMALGYLLVRRPDRGTAPESTWRDAAVVGWAGMRGVVTLAAAFAIPTSMPNRDVLVLIALSVTAGTLFLQGLTLPWFARLLRLPSPDPRRDALARAALFQKATASGMAELDKHAGEDDPHGTMDALRRRVEHRDFAAWERLGDDDPDAETPSDAYARLRLEMLQAERAEVLHVRSTGHLPAEVVADVLVALDVEESMLGVHDGRTGRRRRGKEGQPSQGGSRVRSLVSCDHLEDAPSDTAPNVEGACEDCLTEGTSWVHLRLCLECGHVGCCDSSTRRHATAHFHDVGHPVMASAEPGEDWRWCFVDSRLG
ncbi:MAG TPA: Na+/H+ antiporter [Nocardioidaceae bacterium]|nr:Na+/H+ antiporter [Nocardioidaceae bacterium]